MADNNPKEVPPRYWVDPGAPVEHERPDHRNEMKRDWVGYVIQSVAICFTVVAAIFVYSWHIDARFDDLSHKWDNRFGEHTGLISSLQTQQATLQAQQLGLQHQFETAETRHNSFEGEVSRKLDSGMNQLGTIATDLALLRKEIKH
jgi:hypothetical protein